MTARGGDLEGALGALLTLDVFEVDERVGGFADLRLRTGEHLRAAEMIGELDQRCRGDDLHFRACPGRFGAAGGGADEPFATPVGADCGGRAKRFAGNNLACASCHLQAGTKKFGIPLFGLFGEFPRYSARSGAQMTIEDRLNSCMTRSMNGRALPVGAPEMQAMVAYIKFLSTGVAPGQLLPGMGTGKMPELDRPADPVRGERGYANACLTCHGPNGAGIRRSLPTTDLGYMVPPLWGSDSFNDGAGMARLIAAANFIHFNMPHGVDYLNPQLSPEQAWDIAAYVISQPRPHKAGLDKDFPDPLEKPVDTPYGPYADGFSEQQHKYGPFAPIRAAIAKLKAEQKGTSAR